MPAEPVATEIWRFPVKSMRGERLAEAELLADGMRGDRLLRVEGQRGLITARTRPAMLGLQAGIDARSGEPTIDGEPWDAAAAARSLSDAAPGARLVPTADGNGRWDLSQLLLLGTGTIAELGVDSRRLRPNLIVDGLGAREENSWSGRRVAIGEAVLLVADPCERCVMTTFDPDTIEQDPGVLIRINEVFGGYVGVHSSVERPGRIREGDAVRLL